MADVRCDDPARYVVFGLSGHCLALPAAVVTRFLAVPALERPPTSPPAVAGVFRWQRRVVPVLRLDRLLALPESPIGLYATLLVLEHAGGPLAFAADRVHGLTTTADAQAITEGLSLGGCAMAVIPYDGRSATVLAPQRLLSRAEERLVDEFRAQAEERDAQWLAP